MSDEKLLFERRRMYFLEKSFKPGHAGAEFPRSWTSRFQVEKDGKVSAASNQRGLQKVDVDEAFKATLRELLPTAAPDFKENTEDGAWKWLETDEHSMKMARFRGVRPDFGHLFQVLTAFRNFQVGFDLRRDLPDLPHRLAGGAHHRIGRQGGGGRRLFELPEPQYVPFEELMRLEHDAFCS